MPSRQFSREEILRAVRFIASSAPKPDKVEQGFYTWQEWGSIMLKAGKGGSETQTKQWIVEQMSLGRMEKKLFKVIIADGRGRMVPFWKAK